MALGDAPDAAEAPDAIGGPGPPPGGGPSPPAGGPPQGGGAMLAALAQRRQGPQPSAPGPGNEADSMNQIRIALDLITQALPGLHPGTPIHRDALRALTSLSRHTPQAGGPSAGIQQTMLQDLLKGTIRNAMLMKQQGGGAGGPPGAAGGPPGAGGPQGASSAPPTPPVPSTPFPGA